MYELEMKVWLKAASSAIAGCAGTVEDRTNEGNSRVHPDSWSDEEDTIKDDCSYAAMYADGILREFQEKFRGCY